MIQVTGRTEIDGYCSLDLIFETLEGPVKMNVEAYVVKGMTAPFILGNDFADQYSISTIRELGRTFIQFGDSNRRIEVQNSVTSPFMDEDGHAWKVRVRKEAANKFEKASRHRRNQKERRLAKLRAVSTSVRASGNITIPAQTTKWVLVKANFSSTENTLYMEKQLTTNRNEDDVYGSPDVLIDKDNPQIPISNFSVDPITICQGQVLGVAHNPGTWLDKPQRFHERELRNFEAQVQVLQSIATMNDTKRDQPLMNSNTQAIKSHTNLAVNPALGLGVPEDVLAEPPIEGGPKTAANNSLKN